MSSAGGSQVPPRSVRNIGHHNLTGPVVGAFIFYDLEQNIWMLIEVQLLSLYPPEADFTSCWGS